MNYFLKKHKAVAIVLLVAFMMTMVMPAFAATGTVVKVAGYPTDKEGQIIALDGLSGNGHVGITEGWLGVDGTLYVKVDPMKNNNVKPITSGNIGTQNVSGTIELKKATGNKVTEPIYLYAGNQGALLAAGELGVNLYTVNNAEGKNFNINGTGVMASPLVVVNYLTTSGATLDSTKYIAYPEGTTSYSVDIPEFSGYEFVKATGDDREGTFDTMVKTVNLYYAVPAPEPVEGAINVQKQVVGTDAANHLREQFNFTLTVTVATSPSALAYDVDTDAPTVTVTKGNDVLEGDCAETEDAVVYTYAFTLGNGENAAFVVTSTYDGEVSYAIAEGQTDAVVSYTGEKAGALEGTVAVTIINTFDASEEEKIPEEVVDEDEEQDPPTNPGDDDNTPTGGDDDNTPTGGFESYEPPVTTTIPDTTTPQAQPPVVEAPVIEMQDEPTPMAEVPGVMEEGTDTIEEGIVPMSDTGDAPQMGDSSNAFAFAMVLAAAGLGLVVTRRKFN